MPRGFSLDLSALVLITLAIVSAGAAYWKDPSLPILGAKNGLSMIWFVVPRLVPALILAGMLQVLIPQATVARYFGNDSGLRAIAMASVAGVLTDRVSKGAAEGNQALLFENVEGFGMPVLINAFGSPARMAAALGVERLDDLAARVAKLLDLRMPGSFFDKLKKLGDLFDVAKAGPKRVRSAPCQEVVETDHPSLATLPVLRCWPGDAGRYITLPLVFTRDPVTGARNVGMYRVQVHDERTL